VFSTPGLEDTAMGFPATLQEFQAIFPDEQACWEALRRARWPKGFVCPRCGHEASSWISTRRLEQCCGCRYQCSVTAGTVFHRLRSALYSRPEDRLAGLVELDETYVGGHERAQLSVLEGVRFEEDPALEPHDLRQPQDLAPRFLSRGEPEAPPAVPG
jgi:hypothetical protein